MARQSRCWPGYEPVPGKAPHSQGSCRPKAKSKLNAGEKQFRAKRKKQLDRWQAQHPGSRRSSAQHLSAPGAGAQRAGRKTAAKRPAAKRAKSSHKSHASKHA